MNKMNKRKTYEGQILPIVMIILVVGVVLALALYSKNIRNRLRLIGEKRSTEASREVESVIKMLETMEREELLSVVLPELATVDEYCMADEEIKDKLGVGFDPEVFGLGENAQTEVKLCFTTENELSDGITIPAYDSYSISLNGENTSCTYDFTFQGTAVVIEQIYAVKDADGNAAEIKPYFTGPATGNHSNDDIFGLCLLGTDCSTRQFLNNWDVSNSWSITLNSKTVDGTTYEPHEIRIISVDSSTLMNMTATPDCNDTVAITVTPKATNVSAFQGSYFSIPVNSDTLSIFDYVFYNRTGNFEFTGDD